MDNNLLRFTVFLGVLLICMLVETLAPKRTLTQPRWYRWINNLTLVGFNSFILQITLPLLAFEASIWAQNNNLGLFNFIDLPLWMMVLASLLLMDMIIYWQHRLFHTLPLLWSLHKTHHSDQDIDVTTGARFHPIEIWLSMLIKMATVVALGVPPLAVIAFEVILNASAMFNHSNMRIPYPLDSLIRKILVTPDMHRVHHSTIRNETDSNYGFCLSVWDRLFNSYIEQPKFGHSNMNIGIKQFRQPKEQRLDKILTQPFRDDS